MNFVEQLHPGFHWAEPFQEGNHLLIKQVGTELHITGLFPRYTAQNNPSDLIGLYEIAAKYRAVGKPRTTEESPEIAFANADTDAKLIAFVRRFGPVVATCAYTNFERPEKGLPEPRLPMRLFGIQNIEELRNEQLIYRAALALTKRLTEPKFDNAAAQLLIGEIASKIADWPRQWEREKAQRGTEPAWRLSSESRKRIESLAPVQRDGLLPPTLGGRIVLCALLNSFRGMAFPSPLELHSSIKYGIRPLLYSILQRQFLNPRDFAACANTHCRNFFNIERAGQQFCSPGCSIHQRQRTYWMKSGKKKRKKRLRKVRKAKK